jgi:hypothetical protein
MILRVAVVAFFLPLHHAVSTNGLRWLAATMTRL